jgi:hypothetical protein
MDSLEAKIEKFLEIGDGYGSGYGYGSCSGSGDGSGSGSGSGYGYGSGSGSGDGSGSGSGSGSGFIEFDGHKIYKIDDVPTCIIRVSGSYAIGFTIKDNSVKVPCYIARVENFFAHGETLREAFNDATAKATQAKPIEQRIAETVKIHPDPDCIVENSELYRLHNILTGSCEFGRKQFIERHGISLDDSMTMREFISLTKNDFGGDTIKKLAAAYNITEK